MAEKISTMEVRERLGDYLNRVALRHDQFVELERAAREHLLETLRAPRRSLSQREADRLANEAKHRTRRRKRSS
jgi:hypothetical protein